MSYAENLLTVEKFTREGWRSTPHSRRIEEIVSVYNETNRFTDNFTYFCDEEGFYVWAKDKIGDSPTKKHIGDIINKRSYPGALEAEVLTKLEDWFAKNSEGLALWVSGSLPGKYPCSKIILHRIACTGRDMQKILQNSADLFSATDKDILDLLHEFFPETRKISSLEAMRSLLIITDGNFSSAELLGRIKTIDPNALLINRQVDETQLRQKASHISDLIGLSANPRLIAYEMQRLGLIGRNSISCSGKEKTFSEIVTVGFGIKDRFGSLLFECPECHLINTRPFGGLVLSCQHCGASVRC